MDVHVAITRGQRARAEQEAQRAHGEVQELAGLQAERLQFVDNEIRGKIRTEEQLRSTVNALFVGKLQVRQEEQFCLAPADYDWQHLMAAENPPSLGKQRLYGTCTAMCPAQYVAEVGSELEIVNGEPVYAMKQFRRTVNEDVGNTGADCIRTKQALVDSMETLRTWLQGYRGTHPSHRRQRHNVDTVSVRCLVQDRHRAIRQDLEQQNIYSVFAVRILEEMARYLVATIYELCSDVRYKESVNIDKQELSKIFVSLDMLYTHHRNSGAPIDTEAEFTSYNLLMKTGRVQNQEYSNLATSGLPGWAMERVSLDILKEPSFQWALQVQRAVRNRITARFFQLLQQASYIQACFCHLLFLEECRRLHMHLKHTVTLRRSKHPYMLPVAEVRDMLLLDTDLATLDWLRPHNPIFCITSQGAAAVLLVNQFGGLHPRRLNSSTLSSLVSDKAAGLSVGELCTMRLKQSDGSTSWKAAAPSGVTPNKPWARPSQTPLFTEATPAAKIPGSPAEPPSTMTSFQTATDVSLPLSPPGPALSLSTEGPVRPPLFTPATESAGAGSWLQGASPVLSVQDTASSAGGVLGAGGLLQASPASSPIWKPAAEGPEAQQDKEKAQRDLQQELLRQRQQKLEQDQEFVRAWRLLETREREAELSGLEEARRLRAEKKAERRRVRLEEERQQRQREAEARAEAQRIDNLRMHELVDADQQAGPFVPARPLQRAHSSGSVNLTGIDDKRRGSVSSDRDGQFVTVVADAPNPLDLQDDAPPLWAYEESGVFEPIVQDTARAVNKSEWLPPAQPARVHFSDPNGAFLDALKAAACKPAGSLSSHPI